MFNRLNSIQFLLVFILSTLLVQSCIQPTTKVSVKTKTAKNTSFSISSARIQNNQLVLTGTNLQDVTFVKLKRSGFDEDFTPESVSATQVIANGTRLITVGVGQVFDLIISNASGAATFQVDFTLSNHSVALNKLATTGATAGQVIKFNGTDWVPASLTEAQIYLGTWNASNNIGGVPDLSSVSSTPGEYYIASHAGILNGVSYAIGDWIISDGYQWQKIAASKTSVTSFQGRQGIVTLTPADYVSLINTGTNKITGSSINDLFDVNISSPSNGSVLKYNGSKWVVGTDNTGIAAGSIVNADISASAAIDQSKIANLTTDLAALQSTTGLAAAVRSVTLTGLSSATGTVSASDTILGAFGKMMGTQGDYVSRTNAGSVTMNGSLNFTGVASSISVPTNLILAPTDVTNVQYVTNAIAANGVWDKGASSSINYTAGNVGLGTTTPGAKLDIAAGDLYIRGTTTTGAFKIGTQNAGSGLYGELLIHSIDRNWTAINVDSNSAQLLLVPSSGSVGIGTTSPTQAALVVAPNGAASTSGIAVPGSWYTAGTSTTNKPQVLIEPTGATSNGWHINGTGLGVNAASGFNGNLFDLQINGSRMTRIDAQGNGFFNGALYFNGGPGYLSNSGLYNVAGSNFNFDMAASVAVTAGRDVTNANISLVPKGTGSVGIGTSSPSASSTMHIYNSTPTTGVTKLILQAGANQTASGEHLMEIKSANGTTVAFINHQGDFSPSGLFNNGYNYIGSTFARFVAGFTNQVPITVSAYPYGGSQTADLMQWLAPGGSVLSKVDANGYLSVGTSTSVTGGVATFAGNVGIGTTSPSGLLQINSTVGGTDPLILRDTTNGANARFYFTGPIGSAPDLNINTGRVIFPGAVRFSGSIEVNGATLSAGNLDYEFRDFSTIKFFPSGNSDQPTGFYNIRSVDSASASAFVFDTTNALSNATSKIFEIKTGGSAKVTVTGPGNVGIGVTNPGYKLQVGEAADGTQARANAWNTLSDERLKRDFSIIPDALEKILSLHGYYYYWNRGEDVTKKMGVKAQEVEKVFPEVVSVGKDGFLSVSYNHLVAGVIEGIKQFFQQWTGDSRAIHRQLALKDLEIARLKKDNAETKERLSRIEALLKLNDR